MKRLWLFFALLLGTLAFFGQQNLSASEPIQLAYSNEQSRCIIPDSGPWPACATGGASSDTTGTCVIPASGPWPPCATGGTNTASSGDCVIPASGPWPPCATGGTVSGATNDCVIPPSGPWPACATGGGSSTAGGGAGTSSSEYLASYTISDTGFGTQVNVVVDNAAGTRTIVSNALPNHATGEFPNAGNPNTISAQDASWTYPTLPTFVGTASFAQTPGVAINGIKFTPDTAERATCETGEVYNIEAIQDVTSLGLDFNNAHVQPTGEYHYHGVSDLLVNLYSSSDDLVHVAFAADGHLIYYSKSGAYQPSYRLGSDAREGSNCTYTPGGGGGGATVTFGSVKDGSLKQDWDYNARYGQLDECNGITVNGEYIYLITDDYPYVPRCLMGQTSGAGGAGGGAPGGTGTPPEGGPPGGGGRPPGGPPGQ